MNKEAAEWFDKAIAPKPKWVPDASLLLHPSLPPPLHGTNPRTLKGKVWWDIKRKEAYAKYDYRCYACGVDKADSFGISNRLDAHENYFIDTETFSIELVSLSALCTKCHEFIHRNRMSALFDKGVITESECWEIMAHGNRVLVDSGLDPDDKLVIEYDERDWDKWKLIIDGKDYYSKFNNAEVWRAYYESAEQSSGKAVGKEKEKG